MSRRITVCAGPAGSTVARLGAARILRGGEMSLYLLVPMLIGVALLGWIAGMWTHRRAEHRCPVDGSRLTCAQCQRAGMHPLEPQGKRS